MQSHSEVSQVLHYSCALSVLLVVFIAALSRLGQATETKSTVFAARRHTITIRIAFLLLISTYLVEAVAAALQPDAFDKQQAHIVHLLLSILTWPAILLRRGQLRPSPWVACIACVATLSFEIPLLALAVLEKLGTASAMVSTCCQALRASTVLLLLLSTFRAPSARHNVEISEESRPILRARSRNEEIGYVDCGIERYRDDDATEIVGEDSADQDSDSDSDDDASMKRRRARKLQEKGGWLGYLKDFSIFIPFLVPKNDRKVQFSIFLCLVCIAGKRAMNILIPRQLGIVTDKVLGKEAPYGALAAWLLLSLLSDESGLVLIETLAKIPIKQFSYRQITNAAFSHVMSLPMEFHSERDSAEVMKAIEQGGSLSNLLETAIIDILPTAVDLIIAMWFLYWKFNAYVSLVMLVASVAFIALEVFASNMNIENRRTSSKAEREEARIMHQAVQGWQTVSYFNMFGFEKRRFGEAVDTQLDASRKYGVRDAFIQALLGTTVPITFFILASLVLYEISSGRASAGDFVLLLSYWEFLVWPLKFLSHNYRYLMTDLVDAERLLDLLQTKTTIIEKDNATDLCVIKGRVEFESVGFSYDPRRPTILDLTISAAPGQTVALVGETGAGKSSILKLLLRFYDVTSGRITIDGHDIRDVTLSSLRQALGVVPQDPLLFNASVMENLRYARPLATDEQVFDACRAAAIHEKILTFADGYESKVGEQGVKLSGGEIQRLAIARVFLKDPPILILDEATSAVDTKTEANIQHALDTLKNGRTTFIIAHRLSTVVKASKIVVIHEGRVVESGTHDELLARGERYKDLWTRQIGGASEKNDSVD